MGKRIAAIVFIFACTTVAWMILGGTILNRTYSFDDQLKERVASTWGSKQVQAAPTASWDKVVEKKVPIVNVSKDTQTASAVTQEIIAVPLPLESSRVDVDLDLNHRQKGLLWYSTYKVGFSGVYTFRNTSDQEQPVRFVLCLPSTQAIYDDLKVSIDGRPVTPTSAQGSLTTSTTVPAGKTAIFAVAYHSQGLENWTYKFGDDVTQVRDFLLTMHTNFRDIDFPADTLSPTDKAEVSRGWQLTWRYSDLLTGYQLGMQMPEKLQPGPLAGQISFFAPVSLFFFFFLMFIITTLRGIDLHPMNYFFLAAAFFAFHLLMAYTVDHISIHRAFALSSAVSIFLVITYLRLVVGMRFAAVEAGFSQLVYLVLFSYAFFFKGFTGLAVTIGSIVTLFVVMQLTGRIRWAEKFAAKPAASPQLRPGSAPTPI
ncbi:MAG TPA: inner membrane CreD family protein [Terriglobales bacterium]|jgi:hypothetical protein|nr:inner membrane CreD family protein [Terriglobales bacterium]